MIYNDALFYNTSCAKIKIYNYNMKKDLFGFKNQGINYDVFRPIYPIHMLNKMMEKVKNRNRYIDVATGTGQILFNIYHHFNYATGIDMSPKMI